MVLPRISIVTPCHNQVKFIERTLCSVLDQDYPDLEYLVVDACSVDGTDQIIRHYRDELTWWSRLPTAVPAEAINLALQRATGQIVAILDGDAIYMPGALDAVARDWSRSDRPRWLIGHACGVDCDDQFQGRTDAQPVDTLADFVTARSGRWITAASFFDRTFLEAYGPWDNSLRFCFAYEYWCRLLAGGQRPVVVPDKVLAAFRTANGGLSRLDLVHKAMETANASLRYGERLPRSERLHLHRTCSAQRRILAEAEAELTSRNMPVLEPTADHQAVQVAKGPTSQGMRLRPTRPAA